MNGFKGTKGKWIQNGINGVHLESGRCIALTHSENRKANALLISKAPEMLEMLEELKSTWGLPNKLNERIRQLIKEATDIDCSDSDSITNNIYNR